MGRSEPALVPEWLRNTGSVSDGSKLSHHFTSSTFISDTSPPTQNRSSRHFNGKDSPLFPFLDRSPSNSRRSVTTNSSTHPYSSFTRSRCDKNCEKDKERSVIGEQRDPDSSRPLGNTLTGIAEKNCLRRSQSLVSRKPGELFPQRKVQSKCDMNGVEKAAMQKVNNSVVSGSNLNGFLKAAFEKNFPSLGTVEKKAGRVSSPGLSSAVQSSFSIGNSALVGSEKWTSALAEVPAIIGSSDMGNSPALEAAAQTPVPGASHASTGLNMAEALSQAPARTRATSQVPDKTQRLEELAIKQSRQLIPVTPSIPKILVSSSSDKARQPKLVVRASEMAAKGVQQQHYSSPLANQPRAGHVRSDAPNTSQVGKFLVLKPTRENGSVAAATLDNSRTANNTGGKFANEPPAVAPLSPLTNSTPEVPTLENKASALKLNQRPIAEKKFSLSQAQSRSDFFNLMRKKTSLKGSILPNSGAACSFSSAEESDAGKEVSSPVNPVIENGRVTSNGCSHDNNDKAERFSDAEDLCLNGASFPNEEEAAFLRSLGWDENAGEDEGLTEEEINAFYQEYMKLKPSLNMCKGAQPKCLIIPEFHSTGKSGAAATGLRSSESEA